MLHKFIFPFFFLLNISYTAFSKNNSWNNLVVSYARNNGTSRELEYALSKGATVNAQDQNGVTALMWYAYHRNFPMVDYLLKKGANPLLKGTIVPNHDKDPNFYYGHALAVAVGSGDYGSIGLLLKAGFPINEPGRSPDGKNGYNALHTACYMGNYDMVVHLLYRVKDQGFATANPNMLCEAAGGKTPLKIAMERGFKEIASILIKAGAQVHYQAGSFGNQSTNALIQAIKEKQSPIEIARIIQSGEDVNSRDENGATPIMWASYLDNEDVLKLLIAKGAKARLKGIIYNSTPTARFPYFGNALVAAIGNQAHHTAPILLRKCGLRIDEPGLTPKGQSTSWSALHVAAYGVDPWVIDALNRQETLNPDNLSATNTASDVNRRCLADRGMTPLLYAAQAGEDKLVKQLLEVAADITMVDDKGWTVLHYGVQSGNSKLIQIALEAGLSVNQKTADGQTAMSLATASKRNDLIDLLKASKPITVHKTDGASLQKKLLEIEIAQLKKMVKVPSFLADAFEQMGTLYDRTGNDYRANRYFVEASLAREQAQLGRALAGFRELSFEEKDFGEELQKEVKPLIQKVEKAKNAGCRGIQAAKKDAEDLTAYSLHRQASEYNKAYATCLEQKQDWTELVYTLRMLAFNQKGLQQYDEAEATLKKAGLIVRDHFKVKDQTHVYALTLRDLGKFYLSRIAIKNNNITPTEQRTLSLKAQSVLEKADSCWQKTGSDYSEQLAENLQYLSEAYQLTNDSRIIKTAQQAVTRSSRQFSAGANALHWLGLYYLKNNDLSLAAKTLKEGFSRCRDSDNAAHPYYIRFLDDLAKLYRQLGRYDEATFFEAQAVTTALAVAEETNLHVEEDPIKEVFHHWNENFNHVYGRDRVRRDYTVFSISPHTVELSVYTQILEWINQSVLAIEKRDYNLANEYLSSAYETILNSEEAYDIVRIFTLNLMATVKRETGNRKAQIELLQEACEESKAILGPSHQSYLNSLHELAKAYAEDTKRQQADQLLREGWGLLRNRIKLQADLLSETEFIITKRELDRFLNYHINFYAETAERDTVATARLYEITLLQKGLALRSYAGFLQQLSKQSPREVSQLKSLLKLQNKRQLISKVEDVKWRMESDTLNDKIIQLERQLANGLLSKSEVEKSYTWKNILQMLDASTKNNKTETAAAVELIQYKTSGDREIVYAALVVNQLDRVPRFIKLSTEKQWSPILDKLSNVQPATIDEFYKNKQLYKLAWQPLEKLLAKVKIIYLSTVSGYSQGLAFSALLRPDNSPIVNTQKIRLVFSTSLINSRNDFNLVKQPVKALLVGAVDYSCNGDQLHAKPLLGAKNEIDYIEKVISKNKGTYTTLRKQEATETAFLELSDKPFNLIHLATHGEYLRNTSENERDTTNAFAQQADQSFHTALLMAGSDCGWENPSLLGEQDGILTSREIQSTMSTSCQLVILSACKSALGESEGSEGLLGLYRAFKSVGANYVLASLWNLDDASANSFIKQFYDQLAIPGSTIESAFEATQNIQKKSSNTSAWAGFILMH